MSFGQSSNQKQNQANVNTATAGLNQAADTASGQSANVFNWFKKSGKGAMNFWNTILSGDKTAIMSLLSPEISATNTSFDAASRQIDSLLPRGGGKVSAQAGVDTGRAQSISNLISSARPQAAQQLASLAGLFGQQSLGEAGLGVQALGSSGNLSLGQQQLDMQQQQMINSLISSIASGAGEAAGNIFFGKG